MKLDMVVLCIVYICILSYKHCSYYPNTRVLKRAWEYSSPDLHKIITLNNASGFFYIALLKYYCVYGLRP